MKKMIISEKQQAINFLNKCNPESVEYVKGYKEEIDNLTVVESTGCDFVEVDRSDEIENIHLHYVLYGIDEDFIADGKEFDAIYAALCIADK